MFHAKYFLVIAVIGLSLAGLGWLVPHVVSWVDHHGEAVSVGGHWRLESVGWYAVGNWGGLFFMPGLLLGWILGSKAWRWRENRVEADRKEQDQRYQEAMDALNQKAALLQEKDRERAAHAQAAIQDAQRAQHLAEKEARKYKERLKGAIEKMERKAKKSVADET